jgi:hypothetical protein
MTTEIGMFYEFAKKVTNSANFIRNCNSGENKGEFKTHHNFFKMTN